MASGEPALRLETAAGFGPDGEAVEGEIGADDGHCRWASVLIPLVSFRELPLSILKVSIPQIKAARALVSWSQEELASRSGVSVPTVKRLEAQGGEVGGREATSEKLRAALEAAGVEFIPENGGGAGVRLRKGREDRNNLDQHIDRLEGEVAHLKPAASGKPSPATGMAMLRRGRAKSDLAKAKNKRAKSSKRSQTGE